MRHTLVCNEVIGHFMIYMLIKQHLGTVRKEAAARQSSLAGFNSVLLAQLNAAASFIGTKLLLCKCCLAGAVTQE